ncbi:MAG: sugar phosphate nucleotidyltransferase [Chloroflexota bacterium]|nr:sugar phosphate nucleotidyltransferase [Chloroflexota bacterium]
MTDHFYALIMAGGGGTRLWPLSRGATPKQLLPLVEERSMFRVSVDRLAPLFAPDHIYVVTGDKYADAMRADAPALPADNFIIEPYGKDSGPAAALGLSVIAARDPQATVAILTADHHIADKAGFRAALAAAAALASDGQIVTLGIEATVPATGFGYIRRGELLREPDGLRAYAALEFTEKPDIETAEAFITSGEYSWNSGMFILRAADGMAEFARQQPDIARAFAALTPTVDTPAYAATLTTIWEQIVKISIDYAIMEGAESMAVIPVSIGWSDVGSWGSIFDVIDLDDAGSRFNTPQHLAIDTKNALVYADKLVVLVGVEDLVVIDTEDALLICHKDQTQKVKDVVNTLKAEGLARHL